MRSRTERDMVDALLVENLDQHIVLPAQEEAMIQQLFDSCQ